MNLTRITAKSTTTTAINQLRRAFRERGVRHQRTIGYPGGQAPNSLLYAVEAADIWFSHQTMDNRHWCAFGVLPLPTSQLVGITVEVNPPLEGLDRRVAGLFASDGSGGRYLCHTGRVGGGKKGIGRRAFVAWHAEEIAVVVDPDGKTSQAFPIAELGSPRIVEQIAEYVHAVANFKAGRPPRVLPNASAPFGGSASEREGQKRVRGRHAYTATCDHAIIRNRLAALISATGRKVSRDLYRDIVVGPPTKPDVELEIKTSADSQCIYTAIGQLLLHGTMFPAKRSVAVLPVTVTPRMSRSIASLGLGLVTFRWTDTHVHFAGLSALFPGVADSAPIYELT